MPRRPQGSIPLLELTTQSPIPLHRQLVEAVRQAILSGRLAEGTRLPSTRSLAQDLAVSRSTVVAAFDQLNSEGYLQSRSGSGTVVATGLAILDGGGRPLGEGDGIASPLPPSAPPPPSAFRPGIPALDEFASTTFGRILRRTFKEIAPSLLTVGSPAGDPELRVAIARHLRGSRKVRCSPEDLIITSGAQEGLCLAFEVITERGEEVWFENPGYSGARRAAEVTGARPVPVSVDAEGLVVAEGISRWPDARGAYVTPSHQFPTGCTMALTRRLELLDWAAREERYIIEDDYDSEFRLEGRPLPALQGMDQDDRVIYVGTFSKSLAPSMRLGFILLPAALRQRALELKMDRMGPQPFWLQRTTAVFMEEGHFARHIRRTRALYRERRDCLKASVARHLSGIAALREPTGAMHALLDLSPTVDAVEVVREGRRAGVESFPISTFTVAPDLDLPPSLLLGFAGYPPVELDQAVLTLAGVLKQF